MGLSARNGAEEVVIMQMIESSDKDGGGLLSFCEFLGLPRKVRRHLQEMQQTAIHEVFRQYDRDRSGFLTMAELMVMITDLGLAPRTKAESDKAEEEQMLEGD